MRAEGSEPRARASGLMVHSLRKNTLRESYSNASPRDGTDATPTSENTCHTYEEVQVRVRGAERDGESAQGGRSTVKGERVRKAQGAREGGSE